MEREDSSKLVRLVGGIPFAGEGQPHCALLLEDATGYGYGAEVESHALGVSKDFHGLQGCCGVDGGHWAVTDNIVLPTKRNLEDRR
ncbi:hypothetical protein TRIUR3_08348 [Triticum urartu]|uniref:Uncharacterized protein n=1 Tax=Triticum urartu TaxID=4572 RepID=M8A490_TRIUA|nr:hypothetical protein TRIUR3_08348 [Triticum urartu]